MVRKMKRALVSLSFRALALIVTGLAFVSLAAAQEAIFKWTQHDRNRPQPPVVSPGEASTQERAGQPPSDAVVLYNGHDLSNWQSVKGGPARWKPESAYFEVAPGTGDIQTQQGFGDCQVHVEWAAPSPPHGEDQDRGNSGVFLMGLYEIQVLDSYQSKTYPDGQAAAVYGQYPPLVNAMRPPGQWQTYDIIWRGPRFMPNGNLLRPAYVTVFHNGVLVQDHVPLSGPTGHHVRPPYKPGPDKLPLRLQDHDHPVRFRNVWVRELGEAVE